jgi:acetyltransferase-like isoleucine patch superfamily enzyme
MQITDSGENNAIDVQMPASSPGHLKISGNGNNVIIAAFSGAVEVSIDGDGSSVDVARMRRVGRLRITCKNGGSVSIGELSTAEDLYILADGARVSIGRDCMVSFQVSIRTTDAHGIYEASTGKLLNAPEDIAIRDHVWLAQGAIIAKGTTIGKNSVIGAMSYLSKAQIGDGCLVAGTPARILREGIVWDRRMTEDLFAEGANVDPFLHEHFELGSHDSNADALRRA